MASTARTFVRAAIRTGPAPLKAGARRSAFVLPRQTFRQSHRQYSSEAPKKSSGGSGIYWLAGLLAAGGAGYYAYTQSNGSLLSGSAGETTGIFTPKFEDYQKVYDTIAQKLIDEDDYDDGSYGPVLLRLAWHCSGTYDAETKTGGSNGATMRFAPESAHDANAGLKAARDFLEPIKRMSSFSSVS
jgi:cytochrome c peroxidase